jgi:2-phosphosulfolactate phosphatase
MIQRTSAGTQGLARTKDRKNLLAASFVVAKATAGYLEDLSPALVSFIITGNSLGRDGDEDLACAEYIAGLIKNKALQPGSFTERIFTSSVGRAYLKGENKYLSEEDILLSRKADLFNFVMVVKEENDLQVMRPKYP